MNKKDLIEEIQEGDVLQIITTTFNGGVGKAELITDSFIKIVPFEEEGLSEEFGSIAHIILFPLDEIKLIIKVNVEVLKENAKQKV